ncbi:hypothetical protein SSCG_02349 [Streptomyces clavuligerus]|nr:hypothetical protein SSCG_02349 [Streptomyces clavuligerus]
MIMKEKIKKKKKKKKRKKKKKKEDCERLQGHLIFVMDNMSVPLVDGRRSLLLITNTRTLSSREAPAATRTTGTPAASVASAPSKPPAARTAPGRVRAGR